MAKSIVGIFDQQSEAERAVRDLMDNGFRREDISLIAGHTSGEPVESTTTSSVGMSSTAAGAGTGAVVGGLGGLLVGLGVLAIPGVGPVVAAGPLAATLLGAGVGAAAGGLIGSLMDVGVPEEEAGYYAEGIRRGSTLVAVNTEDEMMIDRAVNIFERHNAIDIDRRVEEWRKSGWTGYDPNAKMLSKETPVHQAALRLLLRLLLFLLQLVQPCNQPGLLKLLLPLGKRVKKQPLSRLSRKNCRLASERFRGTQCEFIAVWWKNQCRSRSNYAKSM